MTNKNLILTGILMLVMVASFGLSSAEAFEPTKKELKVIEKYEKITKKISKSCTDTSRAASCDVLEEKQMRLIFKLNDIGIYLDGQSPNLEHLTSQYNSTRSAAQANIEPVDLIIPSDATQTDSLFECDCEEEDDPPTMYVKSGYKDGYTTILGFKVWDYYAGVDSSDIKTGETTSSDFKPRWTGSNSDLIPYCQMSSVDTPIDATYKVSLTLTDTSDSYIGGYSATDMSSEFRWWDTFDRKEGGTINNQSSGFNILCSLTDVTVTEGS